MCLVYTLGAVLTNDAKIHGEDQIQPRISKVRNRAHASLCFGRYQRRRAYVITNKRW
jgi:hypothetical protein